MAKVSNVQLSVGQESEVEFAEVTYDIEFSTTEVDLDVRFTEWVYLLERDADLDSYVDTVERNLGFAKFPIGNSDDLIGEVFRGTVRPDGHDVLHRTHRNDWNFPANEAGAEEYRALVLVVPEIRRGAAWSNEVSRNLR